MKPRSSRSRCVAKGTSPLQRSNAALRRRRAPIALVACACFVWSLAASVPRTARADSTPSTDVESATSVPMSSVEVNSEVVQKTGGADTVAVPVGGEAPKSSPGSAPKLSDLAPDPNSLNLPPTGVDKSGVSPGVSLKPDLDSPTSLPSGADKSGVSSQAISVPQGSGKIQGMGESFSAQLSTGIATFTVPFALPSARGGAQPSLSLSYSSGGGHGIAGVGWEIGAPFIARQTDRGVPSYADGTDWTANQDRFVFNGGQELVPICKVEGTSCTGALSGEAMPSWAHGWQYFRARVEGSFLRFFWSADHKTWKVQSKSGETMELGVPYDGSGYTGGLEVDPADTTKIFRWCITRHYDAQRDSEDKAVNLVGYRYLNAGGIAYLSDIYDTPPASAPASAALGAYAHHARLRYEARPDPTFGYRRGWRTTMALRLAGVDVTSKTFIADGSRELVRRYHLAYDSKFHVSLLKSVQMEGRCTTSNPTEDTAGALSSSTCPTLPAMRFDYQHVDAYTTAGTAGLADLVGYEGFDERVKTMAASPPFSLDEELTDLFDVNADALPDVLVTAGGMFGGKHGVFYNGQGGTPEGFGIAGTLEVKGEPGLAGADPTTITLKNLNVTAGDVDSNGIADLIHMPKVKTYGIYTPRPVAGATSEYQWEWYGRAVTTASSLTPKIDFGKDAADIRLMDVNGDGLIDAVYSAGTEFQTFFSLGRYQGGFGQFGSAKWITASTASISNDPIRKCVPWAGTPVRWSDDEIKIADMNGDGLPDIVKLQKGKIEYWPGRGDGTWGTGDPAACKAGTFGSGTSIVMTMSPWFTDPTVGALRVDDVNGDGLDDLVQIRFTDVDVWLNIDGLGWTDRHVIKGTPASPSYMSRTRLVDMNGSGTRDIVWGDGYNYRFIDLAGAKRPWVLTKVENGLGKTTELEYASSTQLMLAAEKAGDKWTKKAPIPLHVVVKETIRDNLALVGRAAGAYVTTYSYRNPLYDGLQREFRGFESATVTRVGDENSPTSSTRSTFLLGECVAKDDACTPQGSWKDDPREALKGLPLVSETYDAAGVYLDTIHHTYTLRELYAGRDGRSVKHAFESASDTFLYDTGSWSPSSSKREDINKIVIEPRVGTTDAELDKFEVQSATGRVRLRAETTVDKFGNATEGKAYGCFEGCSPADEVITTVTTPGRPSGDTSGWLWRTVTSYVSGNATAARHKSTITYDAKGNPTKTTATLSGTLALDRFYSSVPPPPPPPAGSTLVAPSPADASVNGEITLDETQYDALGNVTFAWGANGRCRTIGYDTAFSDLPTNETVFVGPLTGTVGSYTCGNLGLVTNAKHDRGLEAITEVRGMHDEVAIPGGGPISRVDYDSFGRTIALYKPDPTSTGGATLSPLPSVKIEYAVGEPVSKLHTMVHDGATLTDASYREAWAFVDGLGRTIATLDEADTTANDLGPWIVNGLTDYDAKGTARKAYLAWFYGGTPETFALSSVPPTRYGRKRYDAFGRGLQTFGLDGATTLFNVYHALSSDAWDAADLAPGPHYGTPASERKDGHGRTIAVTERVHAGSSIEERLIQTQYLATGEVAKITRVRGGDSVVRWMKYDSLGRMVLNVEPNTTKNFNADSATDPSTMKAWRYAYNNAGDLVGTSDARGCGTNYEFDAAGRLLSEDYSPCLSHHPAYSTPNPSAGSGYEVRNKYDFSDADTSAMTAAESGCVADAAMYAGRLYSVSDRGAKTISVYDGRGRVTCLGRQMGKPGTPSDLLSERYAPRWYVQTAAFDAADRPVLESTGAKVPELLGSALGTGDKSLVATSYSKRGSVKQVNSSYGMLVTRITHDADGLTTEIVYGDAAATTTAFDYDLKRRLRSVQTYRGPPSIWTSGGITPAPVTSGPSTLQLVLEDLEYSYDNVDNPTEIRDWRKPADWSPGAKPVTRKVEYDDLYRVTKVGYQYSAGDDTWVSPFEAENNGTGGAATDTRMAKPSPHVLFDKRVLWQTFKYDWLGNTTETDDDAKGFYDRSLGTVTNGTESAGPYQLKAASNSASGATRKGALTAQYDDAGYLVSMAVRRDGLCLPAGAQCAQRFIYDWDEAGRLQRARRWDLAGTSVGTATDAEPTATAAVELRYQYNAGDQRTLKTAVDPSTSDQRHTVFIFGSLELRRAAWNAGDFAHASHTEVPYLLTQGARIARVAYEDSDVPSITLSNPRLHVFFELGDHLGSTSTVLDKHTGELVEKRLYLAYGGAESDYRPSRWKAFRESYGFTGKEEDVEVGLAYFGFRYLNPALGRWISADPKTVHTLQADPNVYAYVHGRLLQAVDPTGLDEESKSSKEDDGLVNKGDGKGGDAPNRPADALYSGLPSKPAARAVPAPAPAPATYSNVPASDASVPDEAAEQYGAIDEDPGGFGRDVATTVRKVPIVGPALAPKTFPDSPAYDGARSDEAVLHHGSSVLLWVLPGVMPAVEAPGSIVALEPTITARLPTLSEGLEVADALAWEKHAVEAVKKGGFNKKPAVVIGRYDPFTGEAGAFASRVGAHAEDVAAEAMPNGLFSKPISVRACSYADVCCGCQSKFPREMFVEGTTFAKPNP
jgi:RHS repeat-associated protein